MDSSISASIQFLRWDPLYVTEKPFQAFLDKDLAADGERNTNLSWEEKDLTISDFRAHKEFQDIDNHGFTSRKIVGFKNLADRNKIEKLYIPTVERLLQSEIEDVGTVFIFDWRIRDSETYYPGGYVNFGDQTKSLLPSNFAHIDMAPISIVHRIQKSFPRDADKIFSQRIRAINVWKPLDHAVEQWSLAVCDGNTILPTALVETDSVRRENTTTLYYATHSSEQRWYFLNKQTPDEALIFKHFDSKPDVKAPFTMHSSIKHHRVSPDAQPRRSIEVRALVFSGKFELSEL
ncbi:methyltransferase CmcJ [Amniculicola lignicola CBS 123094]|uniref:Methyltransferase CmcJ n=1 Tax=Amniculicola lignicola CBS 123094 TaxID=1392246 RepID=A0A6A5WJD7_9PLEO|nr:methyltransferase CmcJ [Amniculicola lignicola CBS 123094]